MERSNWVSPIKLGIERQLTYIANIGDCILEENVLTDETGRLDVCSLGFMMIELMESDTSLRQPKQARLARPEVWKDESGIKEFLDATQNSSLIDLKKVSISTKAKC